MVVPEKQQCAEEQKRAEAIGLTPDGGIDDDGGAEKIGKRDKECAFFTELFAGEHPKCRGAGDVRQNGREFYHERIALRVLVDTEQAAERLNDVEHVEIAGGIIEEEVPVIHVIKAVIVRIGGPRFKAGDVGLEPVDVVAQNKAQDKLETFGEIMIEYRVNPKLPCKSLMEQAKKNLEELLALKEPVEFFKTVDKKRDDLLYDADDTAPVFDFFKGGQKKIFEKALEQIQMIYHVDNTLKELKPEERKKRRQSSVKPLVEAYFAWVKEKKADGRVSEKSKTGRGLSYSIDQEKYLKVFLEDGNVPMDNNAAERAIKNFCIGRKNWLIIDTIRGAQSSAIIYSIAETAKANNLKPYEYFEYLLEEISQHMEDTDLSFCEELLPWSTNLPEKCRKPEKK